MARIRVMERAARWEANTQRTDGEQGCVVHKLLQRKKKGGEAHDGKFLAATEGGESVCRRIGSKAKMAVAGGHSVSRHLSYAQGSAGLRIIRRHARSTTKLHEELHDKAQKATKVAPHHVQGVCGRDEAPT